ncbi:aldo/keto reductase [Microbacterium sp. A93]|uniref:aldo/keto reductase n=1 Tax=Microbacterium sp. A93 TaxID=3450716 RepID=UPI003F42C884
MDIREQLGRLDPRIGLGTNVFGWTADRVESHRILDALVDAGGGPTLVDTADVYVAPDWAGPGDDEHSAEGVLGSWLATRSSAQRDNLVIVTKVGGGTRTPGLSAANIRRGAEESLRILHTDHLDLFYAHKDDPSVPLEESVRAFDALIDDGLVRGIGLSTFSPERMREWIRVADEVGARRPVAVMARYSLLDRTAFEMGYLPIIEEFGMHGFPYFVLASGLLSGRFASAEDVSRSARAAMTASFVDDRAFEIVGRLRHLAQEAGVAPAALATAWVARQPGVCAPIVGARTAEQLQASLNGWDAVAAEAFAELTACS